MNTANETFEIPADAIERRANPPICSWCNKIIGIIKSDLDDEMKTRPAYGICPECFKKTIFERACGIRTDRYQLVQGFRMQ